MMASISTIPDITDTELWILNTTLRERYGEAVEINLGDSEIRLHPSDRELTQVPVAVWQAEDCNFIIFKTGDRLYRGQFFYRLYQQYGTGVHEYDDLTECVVSLLQTQADYEARERGDLPTKKAR